jgi:AAA domain
MNVLFEQYADRPVWCAFGPDKKPINPKTGKLAKVDDRSTFGTYADARARADMIGGGVGIATWGAPELCFLDLDDAIDPISDEPRPWAQKLLDDTGDTLTYKTPSGVGLRIVARDPGGSIQRTISTGDGKQKVEVFQDTNRYVTVTDDIWEGRDTIEPVTGIRDRVVAMAPAQPEPVEFEWGHDTGAEFDVDDATKGERSDKFFALICSMLMQRMTPADCLRVMSETPWAEEKYRGRMEQEVGRVVGKFKMLNGGLPCEEDAADDFPDDLPKPSEAPKKKGAGFLSFDELMQMRDPAWLVKGMIPVGSYGSIIGHSQSFKTFFALGIGLSLATGRAPFRNCEPDAFVPTQFLMIAGEGVDSLKARVRAWCEHQGVEIEDPAIGVQPEPSTINDERALKDLVRRIKAARRPGHRLFIVVDTLSQNFTGDENSTEEMRKFVKGIATLSRELRAPVDNLGEENATVVFIHHLGKDASRGARGSSLLMGDVDFQITLKRSSMERLETEVIVTKQKAAATGSQGVVEMLKHVDRGSEDTLDETLVCGDELKRASPAQRTIPALERQAWLIDNFTDGIEGKMLEEKLVEKFGVSEKTASMDVTHLVRTHHELTIERGEKNARIIRGEIVPDAE